MKKTVCVDLDGTLATYEKWKGIHHFGDPLPGAVEFVKKLSEKFTISIYTTRCNLDLNVKEVPEDIEDKQSYLVNLVSDWLDKNGFVYDKICVGKPICIAIIDDRAISCRPQDDENAYEKVLKEL